MKRCPSIYSPFVDVIPHPNSEASISGPQLRCHGSGADLCCQPSDLLRKKEGIQSAQLDFTWFGIDLKQVMPLCIEDGGTSDFLISIQLYIYIYRCVTLGLMTRPHLPAQSQLNHPFWPCRAPAPRNRTCRGPRARAAAAPQPASEGTTTTRWRPPGSGSCGAATMLAHPKLEGNHGKMRIQPQNFGISREL